MPPVIYMTINDSDFKRKMAKLPTLLDKAGLAATYGAAKFGQNHIRANMPQDTGASVNSIGCLITKNSKYIKQTTIMELYSPHPEKKWSTYGWFDVPWYMFDSSRALTQKWNNGNISAVQHTADILRERFTRDIIISVERVIKK